MSKKEARRWSIEKRLEFIDFQLFWGGQINRSDIMERFGVSVPQASKDLSLYQEAAPKNLDYDLSEKRYVAAKSFKPAFLKPDSDSYFLQLRDDIHALSGVDEASLSDLPSHDIVRMPRRNVSPRILREVLASLRQKKTLDVFYQSMTGDEPLWRTISPHAFVFDGLRWHVRAFCHKRGLYKDFLLSRIQKTGKMGDNAVSSKNDEIWNEIFLLVLKPNPKLSKSQAKAVAQDYDMQDLKLEVKVRLALLYYFLRRLGLEDCDGEKKDPKEQHVVVANKAETRKAYDKAQYVA